MTEFIVQGAPEVCLGLVRQYFESEEWPYHHLGDRVSVFAPSDFDTRTVRATVDKEENFFLGIFGCLVAVVLSLVTLGLFLIVWIIWQDSTSNLEVNVSVSADAIGDGRTRLTISSDKPEHAEPVEEWIKRELIKRKAARSPRKKRSSSDIPTQIRKLAELRDSGAITEREFQSKKNALLKRM